MVLSKTSVAAVVVTYNRKLLLAECIDALLKQTISVDNIIIIDNASSDKTQEFLKEKGYLTNQKIDYVKLSENTGGAGGFNLGIKTGYEKGFQWLWLMDDDGFADVNTLELFLSLNPDQNSCYCPLVIDRDDKNLLSFGFYGFYDNKKIYLNSLEKINHYMAATNLKVIDGWANFYNGIFISREIIKYVGLPRREMFIWGDENEYLFRILSKNFRVKIMLNTFFFHPHWRGEDTGSSFEKRFFNINNSDVWKYYYKTRNELYITVKYSKELKVFAPFLKSFISNVNTGIRVKKLRKFIFQALFDQIFGRTYRNVEELKRWK